MVSWALSRLRVPDAVDADLVGTAFALVQGVFAVRFLTSATTDGSAVAGEGSARRPLAGGEDCLPNLPPIIDSLALVTGEFRGCALLEAVCGGVGGGYDVDGGVLAGGGEGGQFHGMRVACVVPDMESLGFGVAFSW